MRRVRESKGMGGVHGAVDVTTFSFSDALPSLVATTSFLAAFFFPLPVCIVQPLQPLVEASMLRRPSRTRGLHTTGSMCKALPFNFAVVSESVSLATYAGESHSASPQEYGRV